MCITLCTISILLAFMTCKLTDAEIFDCTVRSQVSLSRTDNDTDKMCIERMGIAAKV